MRASINDVVRDGGWFTGRDFPNGQNVPMLLPFTAKVHKLCHLSYVNPFSPSSMPLSRITTPLKCLSPADLRTGRTECKDVCHIHPLLTCYHHLEGHKTSHSSQSPPPTAAWQFSSPIQSPSSTTSLPPTSLDLHPHDMHGIINHLLALLESSWPCIIH